jgi:hypothetical protein
LTKISVATLRRILNSLHRDKPRPAPHSLQDRNPWRREVPMLRLPYNLDEPGHIEENMSIPCRWWILLPAGWNWWPCLVGATL